MRKTGWWLAIASISMLLVISPVQAKSKKYRPFDPGMTQAWTEIDPAEVYPDFEYQGLTPACSNCPGTASDKFTFFAKGGKQNNLVIFFQGGGACWDAMNCYHVPTYTQEQQETQADFADTAGMGIFDTHNPKNPFKKWGFVYIPYCTGDLHWGASDHDYPLNPADPDNSPTITIQHRGFVNFQVVLKWLKAHTKNPERIFVSGSSAGSYGATMAFAFIKEAFPRSRLYLLGDAGNGVTASQFNQQGIYNWDPQMPSWIFPDGYQPETTIAEIYTALAWEYPRSRLGQYATAWDATQVFFYNVMNNIYDPSAWQVADPETGAIFNPAGWLDWHQQMVTFAYDTADAARNYRYYIAAGTDHTILRSPKFYTEKVAGIPFAQWVKAMVYKPFNVKHSKGKGRWRSVECGECGGLDAYLQSADQ